MTMPELFPPHHTWIMLDNGEHRCSCGWSPNYYRDTGMTWDEEVSAHRDRILELQAMDPADAMTALIAESMANTRSFGAEYARKNLARDAANKLAKWGFHA